MRIDVKMNLSKLKQLSAAQERAGKLVAEQMIHEIVTEQKMPLDEGTLQNIQTDVVSTKKEILIVHDTPYAARLYFNPEFNFDQTLNTKAGGAWWAEWIEGNKKSRPEKLYAKFYNEAGGI